MLEEIENKYDKVRKKMMFYHILSLETGTKESTIMSLWFNSIQGFKIPEKFWQKIIDILDDYLEEEKREKRAYEKYLSKYKK